MLYLHLTKDFNPYSKIQNTRSLEFESKFWNGGEPHIRIKRDGWEKGLYPIMITHRIKSFGDLGLLLVAVDAIRREINNNIDSKKFDISLFLPYFPGARQDRVNETPEPVTVKIYADIINSLNFSKVIIFDPHSDVTPALINNCVIIKNHEFVKYCYMDLLGDDKIISDFVLIAPDAGATKKVHSLVNYLDVYKYGKYEYVECSKNRDTITNNISKFIVHSDNLEGKDCIVIDDICDGGITFLEIGQELIRKKAGNLHMVISHGIFSRQFKNGLDKLYKSIYTTDSWRSNFHWERVERDRTEFCKIIPFYKFLKL